MAKDDNREEVFVTEEVTNGDIYDLLKKTHDQTAETNGRVTKLEKRSIGNIICNHPYKSIVASLVLFALPIGEMRDYVITFLTKLL